QRRQQGVITSTGQTNTSLTGCASPPALNTTPAIPTNTTISATVTEGTVVKTYTAVTTATTNSGTTTITFAAGANQRFSKSTFFVDGVAAAPIPAPSALVTCTGFSTVAPQFTGCSYQGTAAALRNLYYNRHDIVPQA